MIAACADGSPCCDQMKPPLGLKLDKDSVLEELNRLRAGAAMLRS